MKILLTFFFAVAFHDYVGAKIADGNSKYKLI